MINKYFCVKISWALRINRRNNQNVDDRRGEVL